MSDPVFVHPNGTSRGLTKLEYFAVAAMQSLIEEGHYSRAGHVAEVAVDYALALEKRLKEVQQ